MADPSVDEVLYRVSLEHPAHWFMTFGVGLVSVDPPYHDIGRVDAFINGFTTAAGIYRRSNSGLSPFFLWLRDEAKAFPQNGWAGTFLERTGGDHTAAIRVLFDYLHQYAELRRPAWFVAFNREPVPSAMVNGLGTPKSLDVRKPEHVAAVGGMPVGSGPAVKLSAFELGDGFVMRVGMPPELKSWWCVAGPRIATFLSPRSTEFPQKAAGLSGPLAECLAAGRAELASVGPADVEACVLDVLALEARAITAGSLGAALVRERNLTALSASDGGEFRWETRPGDRLMIISQPIMAVLRKHGLGPLPQDLATAEPTAWAQCSSAATGRRLAICVEWLRAPEAALV